MAVLDKRRGATVTASLSFSYIGSGGKYAFETNMVNAGVELVRGRQPFTLPTALSATSDDVVTTMRVPDNAPLQDYIVYAAIWATDEAGNNTERVWLGQGDKTIRVLPSTTFTNIGVGVLGIRR